MTGPDTSWKERAACARPGVSTALKTAMTISDPPDAAKLLCAACPVATQCVKWAAGEPEFEGLAGGAVFAAKSVRATPWTPRVVLNVLPSLKRKKWRPDPAVRSHAGQFRSKINLEDVEELAGQGLSAVAVAARFGVSADSLYSRLRRAERDDLWALMRQSGELGRAS